ncbi:MAG: exodeoxyribonuclease V subunit gamma [Chlamydiales bacterium]
MEKVNQGKLFFSNKLEVLADDLVKNLFVADVQKRIIVVPSKEMGKWVAQALADRLGIAAGYETLFLEEAVRTFFPNNFPSQLDLTLFIKKEIKEIAELNSYVKNRGRRNMVLAAHLAKLFHRYRIYGGKVAEEWEKNPTDWQHHLWNRIARHEIYRKKLSATIHLFSFSHIPKPYFYLFQQLENMHYYHLSPCQEFWSDFAGKKEQRKIDPIYLEDQHPFLANLGKMGREFAKMVEESDIETVEHYQLSFATKALPLFQKQLLELGRENIEGDDSIQLHKIPTKHREIEVLYEEILHSPFEPKEIIVMAPDIEPYAPYIQAIFGKMIDYQLLDLPAEEASGLLELLDLEKQRFSAPSLLKYFQKRLQEDELDLLKKWVEVTGIRWGVDAAHKSAILGKECDDHATWKNGIDRLLAALATNDLPISIMEAELLGKIAITLYSLYSDLQLMGKKTLSEWISELYNICNKYLESCPDLTALSSCALQEEVYSFDEIRPLLEEALQQKNETKNGNHLQAVRFCSLLPMRAIPAKMIWLLGMDLDAFPRKEKRVSFDLLRQTQGEYSPSRLDFDRYLFLEAILSTEERFVMSYQEEPSHLVAEFLTHFYNFEKRVHPMRKYDPHYKITSTVAYEMAKAVQNKKQIIAPFALHISPVVCGGEIEISALQRVARSPLRHYFQQQFGISFSQELHIKEEEDFLLSPITLAQFRKESLRRPLEEAIYRLQNRGDYPSGLFKEIADAKIEKLAQNISTTSIEFFTHCQMPKQINEYLWHYPAIKIGNCTITGTLEGVTKNGLHISEKGDLNGVLKGWPLFLLYNEIGWGEPNFITKDKQFSLAKTSLESYLRYFFLASKNPSPLYPNFIESIFHGNSEKLQKEFIAPTYDSALQWALQGRVLPSIEKLIAAWKPETEILYEEMIHAWF